MAAPHPTDEFVFGNCVKCQGLVRVPVTTRATAQVRCPRCNESFELAEILEQEIPALEVISESGPLIQIHTGHASDAVDHQPVPKTDDGRFVIPPQLARDATRRKRRRSSSSRGKSGEQSGVSGRPKSSATARRPKTFKTRRAPSRHPVLDVVLVVLGGCMSVPVAQLLIWWFLGADPLGLAPHTARIVPFLVPTHLRAEDRKSSEPDGANEADGENVPADTSDSMGDEPLQKTRQPRRAMPHPNRRDAGVIARSNCEPVSPGRFGPISNGERRRTET